MESTEELTITEELIDEADDYDACAPGLALARALAGSPVAWLRPSDLEWLADMELVEEIEPIDPPPGVLTRLAGDEDADVRYAVASHPSCPADVLVRLAGDDTADVRWAAAQRPSCPIEALARLAGDADGRVREAVACNASCPAEVLARLDGDEDKDVRFAAANRLKCNATR